MFRMLQTETPNSKQMAVLCQCSTVINFNGFDVPLICDKCNEMFPDGILLKEELHERTVFHFDKEIFI